MLERFLVPKEDQVLVDSESMTAATKEIFLKMGLSEEDSQLSAEVLMVSDLRGCESHGVSNMLPVMLRDLLLVQKTWELTQSQILR